MESRDSPFPLGWYTCGRHPDFWGDIGSTYGLIPYGDLPPLDHSGRDGSFDWLPDLPRGDVALAFEDPSLSAAARLARLAEEAAREGLSLPDGFSQFISSPRVHRRVPTCTACYLDLADHLIAAPGAPGRLLRFMNDQQGVLLWYLYLRPDGQHAILVCTPEWDDDADGETLEDVVRLTEILCCAPTFEEFIHRFWLENAIWYSLYEARPMTHEQKRYLDAVRKMRRRITVRPR
jgi:hypothetical protein